MLIHKYDYCGAPIYHLLISFSSKDFLNRYVFIDTDENTCIYT